MGDGHMQSYALNNVFIIVFWVEDAAGLLVLNIQLYYFRASPAVWQIELSSLIFGKNVKNTSPTVWQKT